MFHVVLYQPEIPPNTGNIIRLCANAGCTLHLIEPLGFSLDSARVRRAGMDYAELAEVRRWPDPEPCLDLLGRDRVYTLSSHSSYRYSDATFRPGDVLMFGPETRGLPAGIRDAVAPERRLTLPMHAGSRSLNLSNAVSIVVYEAWRQNGFGVASAD